MIISRKSHFCNSFLKIDNCLLILPVEIIGTTIAFKYFRKKIAVYQLVKNSINVCFIVYLMFSVSARLYLAITKIGNIFPFW